MSWRKILVSLLCVMASSCATPPVPFSSTKPVGIEGNFYTREFTQDGKRIDRFDLMGNLAAREDTHSQGSLAQIWYYTALVCAGVGGYLIGYNAVSSDTGTKTSGLLFGAGFVGLAFLGEYASDRQLTDGVRIYNEGFPARKTPTVSFRLNY